MPRGLSGTCAAAFLAAGLLLPVLAGCRDAGGPPGPRGEVGLLFTSDVGGAIDPCG